MVTAKVTQVEPVDLKLEVVVLGVADVDRAKAFYEKLGWRLDADFATGGFRVVQLTPHHSDAYTWTKCFMFFPDEEVSQWQLPEEGFSQSTLAPRASSNMAVAQPGVLSGNHRPSVGSRSEV